MNPFSQTNDISEDNTEGVGEVWSELEESYIDSKDT